MLIALDFDGTLSPDEMLVLLAEQAGVRDQVETITTRAMAGEMEYAESLRRRVALLDGLAESDVHAAYTAIRLRDGVGELLHHLRESGAQTAILTGGFEDGVMSALESVDADVDRLVANHLEIKEGSVTGEVTGPLVEGTKDEALQSVAADMGIPLTDTIAVGDGANDRPMLTAAGFAIGFQPDASVAPVCDALVDTITELEGLLAERT